MSCTKCILSNNKTNTPLSKIYCGERKGIRIKQIEETDIVALHGPLDPLKPTSRDQGRELRELLETPTTGTAVAGLAPGRLEELEELN